MAVTNNLTISYVKRLAHSICQVIDQSFFLYDLPILFARQSVNPIS